VESAEGLRKRGGGYEGLEMGVEMYIWVYERALRKHCRFVYNTFIDER
jgi:hypothetical protein